MSVVTTSVTAPAITGNLLSKLRNGLDCLYRASGYLAAACMVGILAMTVLQIGARVTGYNVRGASDYAGYFMAASAFLAFPYALNEGAHIRIEIFLSLLGKRRPWMEKISFVVASFVAGWFAFYSWKLVYWSFELGDMSQGMDATPLWIPQLTMSVGASLFAVAIFDHTLRFLVTGKHGLPASPDSV
jgi:TRAP-type C4-dicarboxylate transport system permease small subunit